MDVFVTRQPIFDKERRIYAYELLFRTESNNSFPDIDETTAASSLLSSSFFTVGIEKVGAGRRVFINFTEELLLKGTPQLFPPKKMGVEILENVTPRQDIIDACSELKRFGFLLALDDFVYSKKYNDLLELGDIIRIDFRLTPEDRLQAMLEVLSNYKCKLLAEKVVNYEDFHRAKDLGFDYFQGDFFAKPEVMRSKELSVSQMSMMQLISHINTAEFDVTELEKLVSQDVSITYKLLKYINSSHFSRIQSISSVRQAISFLGEREFKQFVTLIATSKLAETKPNELIRSSVIRARFLELIGRELQLDSRELFLLGLFSHIDAMLDQPMESIINNISLSSNITKALTHRKGDLFPFLRLLETYEKSNWIGFRYAQKKTGIDETKITNFYLEAITWADSFQ